MLQNVPTPVTVEPSGSSRRPRSCVFAATVRNCERHLDTVLQNIASTRAVFDSIAFVFSHDNCTDRSLDILQNFRATCGHEVILIENQQNNSPYRTHRIAKARNAIIECIEERFASFDFFAMFDADEVCAQPIRLNVLERYLDDAYVAHWDALTFDHVQMPNYPMTYYDLWALLFGPFVHNSMGFGPHSRQIGVVVYHFLMETLTKIPWGSLLPCRSAFGGFALYRRAKFAGARYDASVVQTASDAEVRELKGLLELLLGESIKLEQLLPNETCEHISFYAAAAAAHGAKVVLANDVLFGSKADVQNHVMQRLAKKQSAREAQQRSMAGERS